MGETTDEILTRLHAHMDAHDRLRETRVAQGDRDVDVRKLLGKIEAYRHAAEVIEPALRERDAEIERLAKLAEVEISGAIVNELRVEERDADVARLTAEVEHLRREIRLWETSHEDDDLTLAREQYEAAGGRSLAANGVYVTALRLHYEQTCRRNDALTSEVARLRMQLHERGRGCAYCESDPCSCTRSLLAKP